MSGLCGASFHSTPRLGLTMKSQPIGIVAVRHCPHDPSWAQQFIREQAMIAATLGVSESEIHHVGSTAVAEVIAKPIVDILVFVSDHKSDFVREVLQRAEKPR